MVLLAKTMAVETNYAEEFRLGGVRASRLCLECLHCILKVEEFLHKALEKTCIYITHQRGCN